MRGLVENSARQRYILQKVLKHVDLICYNRTDGTKGRKKSPATQNSCFADAKNG